MSEPKAPEPDNLSRATGLREALAKDGIHVWTVRTEGPDEVVEGFTRVLSTDENERAGRFRFDHLRRSYVLSRGALRFLAGAYMRIPPAAIAFRYGSKGKPSLDSPEGVDFNVSHSEALAVFAFAAECEIGVDVEQIRPIAEMQTIASRYFCTEEAAELMSLAELERPRAFFLCWTRKEAYLKAVGDGLSAPLDAFRVSLIPGEPARFLHIGGDSNVAREWVLHDLQLAENYAAAVAYRGPRRRLAVFPLVEPADLLRDPSGLMNRFALAMRGERVAGTQE